MALAAGETGHESWIVGRLTGKSNGTTRTRGLMLYGIIATGIGHIGPKGKPQRYSRTGRPSSDGDSRRI